MKKNATPIPFAVSQLGETRRVCALKFGAITVIDIIRTHPMVIIGGVLQYNPFYVQSEGFLREFRQRRSAQTKPPSTVA